MQITPFNVASTWHVTTRATLAGKTCCTLKSGAFVTRNSVHDIGKLRMSAGSPTRRTVDMTQHQLDDKSHATIPMRSAIGDSKTPYNYAHTSTPKAASSHRYTAAKKNDKPTAAATVAHTRYLSSSPAATLHGKTQGFVLRLPPQLTTCLRHRFPSSPLSIVTTSLRHHFPSSPLPIVTTSHRHHLPSSTSLPHHFPSSPPHHFPSSPLPFIITSLRHHLPSSTSLPHHFPSSPLPFLTTPLHHHFPSSPLPIVPTSLPHHFPSSPLPFVTTFLRHHPSLSPPFIKINSTASCSFVMYCYVLYCYVIYHPSSFQVSEFYLSVTRKYCFPTSFDNMVILH